MNTLQENLKTEMVHALQKLIQIKSTKSAPEKDMPFGEGIQQALEFTLALGESLGFKTKNIQNHAGYIEWGTGKEMVGILCHLDVVPEGENWTYPPFSGTLLEDRITGRGTLDDKGPAIASLYAMKSLADSGFVPKKRVRLILGTDEESGSKCMERYLKTEEIPTVAFSPDADFPVIHGEMGIAFAELTSNFSKPYPDGGIQVLKITGGNAPNMVPDYATAEIIETYAIKDILDNFNAANATKLSYEKKGDRTLIHSHGISAHGSTPERGLNAISQLIRFLDLLDLEIGDPSGFIRYLWTRFGMETNGESFGIFSKDIYNDLVCNLGLIDFTPEYGKVTLNIRYPITQKESKLKSALDSAIRGHGIELTQWRVKGPLFFKHDHPLVKTLMKVYRDHTGDTEAKPKTIGGGTYARSIPNAVAFGGLFPGREDTMHQKDEYILIEDLYKMTEIFSSAIMELSQ